VTNSRKNKLFKSCQSIVRISSKLSKRTKFQYFDFVAYFAFLWDLFRGWQLGTVYHCSQFVQRDVFKLWNTPLFNQSAAVQKQR
jgi:hypothetical protein